jgi:hypothetical protein
MAVYIQLYYRGIFTQWMESGLEGFNNTVSFSLLVVAAETARGINETDAPIATAHLVYRSCG